MPPDGNRTLRNAAELTRQAATPNLENSKLFPHGTTYTPSRDGDVGLYNWDETRRKHFGPPHLYFVNGVQTSPRSHRFGALYLSWLTDHTVEGIYVAKFNPSHDANPARFSAAMKKLGQDPEMQRNLLEFMRNEPRLLEALGPLLEIDGKMCVDEHDFFTVKGGNRQGFTPATAHVLLIQDGAVKALYEKLIKRVGKVIIVAHSRGNLVTSCALWALRILRGRDALRNIEVFAMASPAAWWPQQDLVLHFYNYEMDPITWLSTPNLASSGSRIPAGVLSKVLEGSARFQLTMEELEELRNKIPYLKPACDAMLKSLAKALPTPPAASKPPDAVGRMSAAAGQAAMASLQLTSYGHDQGPHTTVHSEVGKYQLWDHYMWNHCLYNYLRMPAFDAAIQGAVHKPHYLTTELP